MAAIKNCYLFISRVLFNLFHAKLDDNVYTFNSACNGANFSAIERLSSKM